MILLASYDVISLPLPTTPTFPIIVSGDLNIDSFLVAKWPAFYDAALLVKSSHVFCLTLDSISWSLTLC